MIKKISDWLLITLVLSLGFGQLLRLEYLGLPLYLHDILVISILILRGLTLKVEIPQSLKMFLAGLALGWIFALLHYPLAQLLVPSLYTLRLLAYLALYLQLRATNYHLPKTIFLISALVCCFIGLLQYYLLPDMRLFQYLGWDDHLNRLTLPHFDPTFTALMLSLVLLTIPLKSWFVSLLLSFAILLTYSRSVWLSLILTSLFFIKNKIVLLLAVGCMLLAVSALPERFGEGTNLLRTYSITSRFESDLAYIQKYKWDLLVGRGLNTLILDMNCSNPACAGRHATGPNNSYLYLLTTTGILGLVGWGIFIYGLFQKSSHKPMLIFFFIASLFNNVMFYPFALLWILLIETQQNKFENLRI